MNATPTPSHCQLSKERERFFRRRLQKDFGAIEKNKKATKRGKTAFKFGGKG